jgi:hypothetical protein
LTGQNNEIIWTPPCLKPVRFSGNRQKGEPFGKKTMTKQLREVVIARDQAAFRLDGRGRWHSEEGEFLHRKIIEHFMPPSEKTRGAFT